MHQLELTGGEWKNPADIVSDAQREQGDDHQQQKDPPEAQVLHKLLPSGSEARQHALAALKVGVQERVALHGTETHRAVIKQQLCQDFTGYHCYWQPSIINIFG